jgi:hypothetical protein
MGWIEMRVMMLLLLTAGIIAGPVVMLVCHFNDAT